MKRSAVGFLLFPGLLIVLGFSGPRLPGDPGFNHAVILKSLNKATLEKGRLIYTKSCITCHGANGIASYPQARSFSKDPLHYGKTPYAMWRTISHGAGLMAAQTWLSPAERYYVIQYIRETFIRQSNPGQYFRITGPYLAGLPKSDRSASEQLAITRKEALTGSQKYGQEWFKDQSGNYGPAIYSQLKDHATAALTVDLGRHIKLSYNLLRMNTTAAWQGDLDLSETKYRRYRGEGQPAIRGKELAGLNTWQWAYGDRFDSLQKFTGIRAPLPSSFLDYHGHYGNQRNTVLSYAIDGRDVLEYPQALIMGRRIVLSQTLYVSPGDAPQKLYIADLRNGMPLKPGDPPAADRQQAIPDARQPSSRDLAVLKDPVTGHFVAAGIVSDNKEITCVTDNRRYIVVTIPASQDPILLQIFRTAASSGQDLADFSRWKTARMQSGKIPDPNRLIKDAQAGDPANVQAERSSVVQTRGILNDNKAHFDPIFREDSDRTSPLKAVPLPADYPYTVDNIGLPFDNAYHTWVRPTCLGFKSDGSLVIGTYTGDVWIATGIDDRLAHISWRRIATGLFEPMGLKVVKDQIYVTTRNGIVRLRDLNGDGETDFYENFFSDPDVSSFFHAFNFGLETDSKGNFYYTKVGEYTDNKEPGNVIKVSPDGRKWESIATGFRVNNGITITPDDKIFVSDNQGDWEPANKICLIDQDIDHPANQGVDHPADLSIDHPAGRDVDHPADRGVDPPVGRGFDHPAGSSVDPTPDNRGKQAFYGYVPNLISDGWSPDGKKFTPEQMRDGVISPDFVKVPDTFHQPVIWMPQEFDNSPGGGVWSDKSWGPLGDRFIHTSYGTGWAYYFLTQAVDSITQGALIALPFQLDAGIQRAAVNPVDKQVYVVGLTGWDDPEALKYGVLSRIRYKCGKGHLLTGARVVKGGLELSFNCKLDEPAVRDVSRFEITQWNYKWSNAYGSDHYSIREPGRKGEDPLRVREAMVGSEGYSVVLKIPEIGPAQTVRLRFDVRAADGAPIKNSIYLTIRKMPE
ncbi:MAG: c-type cytochrome [Puia sp.]|nr:c-type cytochrome [Puia sp.]